MGKKKALAEMVREATAEMMNLLREDFGWNAIGAGKYLELSESDRQNYVQKSRIYGRRDALGSHIIRLWQNYGLGTGVNWSSDEVYVKKKLSLLWNDPANKIMFSKRGQREVVRSFLTDGELFLICFPGTPSRWRIADSLEFISIATDSDDEYSERYYKRQRNGVTKVYASLQNNTGLPAVWQDGQEVLPSEAEKNAYVFHIGLDSMKGRGYPLLTASLEWILVHRQFMRSRIAIQQELARIARKEKVKGGPTAVNAAAARAAAARAARRNSTDLPAMATTRIENEAATLETMDFETGASAAQTDGAMILQLAGIGSSVFTHYLGAGEAFRLATATAMEAPMLISFMAFQEAIRDLYSGICDFELRDVKKPEDEKELYTLELPEIFNLDVPNTVNSAATLTSAFPDLADNEEFIRTTLLRANYRNAGKILEEIEETPDAPAVTPSPPVPPGTEPTPKPKDPLSPEEQPINPKESNVLLSLLDRIAKAREAGTKVID